LRFVEPAHMRVARREKLVGHRQTRSLFQRRKQDRRCILELVLKEISATQGEAIVLVGSPKWYSAEIEVIGGRVARRSVSSLSSTEVGLEKPDLDGLSGRGSRNIGAGDAGVGSCASRYTRTGRAMFLTCWSPRSSKLSGTRSRTCSNTALEITTPPGSASASNRAAMFTASP
jgi:hypothetical protein